MKTLRGRTYKEYISDCFYWSIWWTAFPLRRLFEEIEYYAKGKLKI